MGERRHPAMARRTVPDHVFTRICEMESGFIDLAGAVTALTDLKDDAEEEGRHWLAVYIYRTANDLREAYYQLHDAAAGNNPKEASDAAP